MISIAMNNRVTSVSPSASVLLSMPVP